jgi:stage II sporulation protein D
MRSSLAVALAIACRPGAPASSAPAPHQPSSASGEVSVAPSTRRADSVETVGIALTTAAGTGQLSATGSWRLTTAAQRVVVRGTGRGSWTIEPRAHRLHISSRGVLSATRDGPLIAEPTAPDVYVTWNGRRYRGSIELFATDRGVLAVNRLGVEDYLRGVVPLEIGTVGEPERAALEAQAVAARSYTYVRLDDPDRPPAGPRYDLVATVTDQVYGGRDAENPVADEAVDATSGEVITYGGRVVNAPYHSACGGTTAEPEDVWREAPEPYLQRVSDRIPGTDHYYCEGSSHFRWTRTFTRSELADVMARYLRRYAEPGSTAGHSASGVGTIRAVTVEELTPSGRVGSLAVTTSRTTYHVRGNDIRFVLREPNDEILHSTYFLIRDEPVRDGAVAGLTLEGRGNGHGVGMCQWGAIGRARAGQDYRTILQTYYPGTTLVREH